MNTKTQCRFIYKEAFKDYDDYFENLLFKHCYKYSRILTKSEKVVSMLFALPCEIITKNEKLKSLYIYAAATLKSMRGKGYMTKLIENVKKENVDLIFLRPANNSLIKFYKKLGFIEIKTDNKSKSIPFAEIKGGFLELFKKDNLLDDKENFTLMYYSNSNKELEKLYFRNSME